MIPSGVPPTCAGSPRVELAGVHRVEAVYVLDRVDRTDDLRLVDPCRQGQLDEQAVDRVVRVELRHRLEHLCLARGLRQADVSGADPDLLRGLVLGADVDVGGGVVAHEHRREADAAELGDLRLHLLADARGKRLPVHDRRCHRRGG